MKKVLFLAAATAAIVSSCSQSAESVIEDNGNNIETSQTPVNMSVYTASSTRAGEPGNITNAQSLAKNGGFGVFAYQTGSKDYAAGQTEFQPDFMYNQLVNGTDVAAPVWSYSPIKFWPNDNDEADNAGAKGLGKTGKVSFFAYAPYADLNAKDANKTSGIIAVSDNDAKSDPTVTYKLATTSSDFVDLLWGTAEASNSAAKTNGTTVAGKAQNGKPLDGGKAAVNVDLTKMKTNGRILFVFKHALAKFGGKGGIKIKAAYDENNDGNTKITVKSITITTEGANESGFTTGGTLNLATGVWSNTTTSSDVTYTSTISGDNLADAIKEPTTVSAWADLTHAGVTTEAQNVFSTDATDNGFFLIPDAALPKFKVTVDYFVRTEDSKLKKGYSETENKITKTVSFGEATAALNKSYSLTITLGMTSVKFDATVSNWEDTTGSGSSATTNNTDVNLPINVTDNTSSNGSSSSSENTGSTTNGK